MLEFFRAILDAVLAITPKALAARKDAKLNALGAELFVLYLRAHRIADNGDYLVALLSRTVTLSDEDLRDPGVRSSWVRRLRAAVDGQRADFEGLNSELARIGGCLAVLDPAAYGGLKSGLWSKHSRIDELRGILSRQALPGPRGLGVYPGADPLTALEELMAPGGSADSLDLREPLDRRTRAKIRRYLDRHQPQAELAEIRAHLEALHAALERTFTLSDILVSLAAGGKADPGGFLRSR